MGVKKMTLKSVPWFTLKVLGGLASGLIGALVFTVPMTLLDLEGFRPYGVAALLGLYVGCSIYISALHGDFWSTLKFALKIITYWPMVIFLWILDLVAREVIGFFLDKLRKNLFSLCFLSGLAGVAWVYVMQARECASFYRDCAPFDLWWFPAVGFGMGMAVALYIWFMAHSFNRMPVTAA